MLLARKLLAVLLWLYVLGVLVQFFLAGLGTAELGGESIEAHRGFGYAALHITPIILLVIAVIARAPKPYLVMMVVFAVVALLQPFWASQFQGEALAALHVVGAGVILLLAHALARTATRQLRAEETQ